MAASTFASNSWSPPFDLTSKDLSGVTAIVGQIAQMEEKPVTLEGQKNPGFYERSFKLTVLDVLRGDSKALKKEGTVTFAGFTSAASNQRSTENRCCLLNLEGQDFFDSSLPAAKSRVLLLIGAPALIPVPGHQGNSAAVRSGALGGRPARPFLLEGIDAELEKAVPYLLGWQKAVTPAAVNAALAAPHPLVGLDALRITMKEQQTEYTALAANHLLFPTQLSGVRTTAVALVSKAISLLPGGSKEAETLIDVILKGWEAERTYRIEAAYLAALNEVPGYILNSGKAEQVKAVAEDYQLKELSLLAEQLSAALDK